MPSSFPVTTCLGMIISSRHAKESIDVLKKDIDKLEEAISQEKDAGAAIADELNRRVADGEILIYSLSADDSLTNTAYRHSDDTQFRFCHRGLVFAQESATDYATVIHWVYKFNYGEPNELLCKRQF